MADENDQNQDQIDPNNPPVEMPEGGSTADKISALERMENGLLTKLYNASDVEEQTLITGKMDYVSKMIDKLSETQKAIQAAGKTVVHAAQGGYSPHDQIRALSVLQEEAASAGDVSTYRMYRQQRKELVAKYGAPGTSTPASARNPDIEELKKIAAGNAYKSENSGASIETRMQIAAEKGDMATYKELRSQRKQQSA